MPTALSSERWLRRPEEAPTPRRFRASLETGRHWLRAWTMWARPWTGGRRERRRRMLRCTGWSSRGAGKTFFFGAVYTPALRRTCSMPILPPLRWFLPVQNQSQDQQETSSACYVSVNTRVFNRHVEFTTPEPIALKYHRPLLPMPANRLKDAVEKLRKASRASLAAAPRVDEQGKKPPGRIQVTVDVLELGPIELEVRDSPQLLMCAGSGRTRPRVGALRQMTRFLPRFHVLLVAHSRMNNLSIRSST